MHRAAQHDPGVPPTASIGMLIRSEMSRPPRPTVIWIASQLPSTHQKCPRTSATLRPMASRMLRCSVTTVIGATSHTTNR